MQDEPLNGIGEEALTDTVRALTGDPDLAKFRFRSTSRWHRGSIVRTEMDGYFGGSEEHRRRNPIVQASDTSSIVLGTDTAATPYEHLLHAVAGCLSSVIVLEATAAAIRIDRLEVQMSCEVDLRPIFGIVSAPNPQGGYINLDVKLTADADASTLIELCRRAEQRSPILGLVSGGIRVAVRTSVSSSGRGTG